MSQKDLLKFVDNRGNIKKAARATMRKRKKHLLYHKAYAIFNTVINKIKRKGNATMTKTKNNKPNKAKKTTNIKKNILGITTLVVAMAQVAAAYILYFNDSLPMQVIAGILALQASYTLARNFTK